jgi:hypothetical protein
MHIPKRHLSKHRIQRLMLWTLAMLIWVQALLNGDTKRFSFRKFRQRRDHIARLRRPKHKTNYGRARMRRHLIRSVLGSRLRAVLKHRSAQEAVAKLIDALRNIDVHAQHLAQRLKCGLTRLNPTKPCESQMRASLVRRSFSEGGAPAFANSS